MPVPKAHPKEISEFLTPTRLEQSHHGSMMLPYLARVGTDYLERRPQTPLQRKLAMTLSAKGLLKRCVARYRALPNPVTGFFSQELTNAATPAAEVDHILFRRFAQGWTHLREEAARATTGMLTVRGALSDMQLVAQSAKSIQSIIEQLLNQAQPPAPQQYNFWLDYRGISPYVADEEPFRGGVDPYFQTQFLTITPGSIASTSSTPPLIISTSPQDLHSCDEGHWYPNGGLSEWGLPNWIIPIYYTADGPVGPAVTYPPLSEDNVYIATCQVWESDDNQVPAAMEEIGSLLVSLGSNALTESPQLGIVLIAVGAVSEILGWLTASDDDYVGAFCLLFDKDDMEHVGDRTIAARVQATTNDNDWALWFGVRSGRI
jgi:hypothetical protein